MRAFLFLIGGVVAWHLVDQVANPMVTLAALVAVGVFSSAPAGCRGKAGAALGAGPLRRAGPEPRLFCAPWSPKRGDHDAAWRSVADVHVIGFGRVVGRR